jgi:hypothetical protein
MALPRTSQTTSRQGSGANDTEANSHSDSPQCDSDSREDRASLTDDEGVSWGEETLLLP